MSEEIYRIWAQMMRYWYIGLIFLLVIKGWRDCISDNRLARKNRGQAGGADSVGELVVLEDGVRNRKRSLKGARLQVGREGLIGSGRIADIRIRHADVRRKHLWLNYEPGRMIVTLIGRAEAETPMAPDGRRYLRDGDKLIIGKLKMMMVFYSMQDASEAQRGRKVRGRPVRKATWEDNYEENFWE